MWSRPRVSTSYHRTTPPSPARSRRRAPRPKVLLTPIAEPHPKHPRDLLSLLLRQPLIKRESLLAFAPARCIIVRVPVAPRRTDAPARLFDQLNAAQRPLRLVPFHAGFYSSTSFDKPFPSCA